MLRNVLVGIVVLLIGGAMLIAGVFFTFYRLDYLGRCLEAKAVVADIEWELIAGGEHHQFEWVGWPVFQFVDSRTGEQVTARGSTGSTDPAFSVGQEVDILYDPENPAVGITVKSFWDLWLPSIVFPLVGAPMIVVGLVVVIRGLKGRDKSQLETQDQT